MSLFFQSPLWIMVLVLAITVFVAAMLMRSPRETISGRNYKAPPSEAPTTGTGLDFMGHINRGNELLARYEFDQALVHFQEALKIRSHDPAVHFKIGRVFLQKEDYRNATVAFQNVLNLDPGQIEAHFELARIFQQQKKPDQAHQELNQALTINPVHEEALKLKIKLYEQEEKYQQALPVVKKLIGLSRQPLKYRALAAEYLVKMGKHDEAIEAYEGLAELDADNRALYHGKIGQACFDQGNYGKAIEFFKRVLQEQDSQADPAYLANLKSQMAASLCNEGVRYFEAEDYTTSIQRYQEALLYDDANADIHYNLGKAYTRTRDTMNAVAHFEAAIALNPNDIGCYYELAVLQDEKGLIKEATSNYERVLALDPGNLNAVFGLGTLYGVQGDMDQAIRYLTEAVRLNPQFTDAIYNLGVALERKKDFAKAIQMYKKVLSLDEDHEKARSNLAHIKHLKAQGG